MNNYGHQNWNTGDVITSAWGNKVEDTLTSLLLNNDIKGAIQTPTYTGVNITQVLHQVSAVTVRTDTFSYTQPLITETRTLPTGESLTLKYYFNIDNSYNRTEVS